MNDPSAIRIHDDLMHYMFDTLKWIPSFNPDKRVPYSGLCTCGNTVIKSDGAVIAARVFHAWANLFAHGPEQLCLTGLWSSTEGEPHSGQYLRIEVRRDEVVSKLMILAGYADQVAESNDELYMLHMGI